MVDEMQFEDIPESFDLLEPLNEGALLGTIDHLVFLKLGLDDPINEKLVQGTVESSGEIELLGTQREAQPLAANFVSQYLHESGGGQLLSY
jgi:hypothetical protein